MHRGLLKLRCQLHFSSLLGSRSELTRAHSAAEGSFESLQDLQMEEHVAKKGEKEGKGTRGFRCVLSARELKPQSQCDACDTKLPCCGSVCHQQSPFGGSLWKNSSGPPGTPTCS